jgi:formylglycine-generating enzyme required for sulfatase activity
MRTLLIAAALLLTTFAATPHPASAAPQPGETFQDCPNCPQMVVVPPGRFQMGSTEAETTREGVPNQYAIWEKPVHTVTIPKAFAVGKFAVTWVEFNAFVKETGFTAAGCVWWDAKEKDADKRFKYDEKRDWKDPGFPQTSLIQPVVCVSWEDAQKYVKWLSDKSGQPYRLLSEAEWEYAARAGTTTTRYWGDKIGSGNANCGDCGSSWDLKQTAPSGSFKPNGFGLFDMLGNAWQWTSDCWNESYDGAPVDGSPWTTGNCNLRVLRGGSWGISPGSVRAARRSGFGPGYRYFNAGFRVARTLP